jgi:hypothetical protein
MAVNSENCSKDFMLIFVEARKIRENIAGVIVKVPRDVPLKTNTEVLRYVLPLYCVQAAKQNGSR